MNISNPEFKIGDKVCILDKGVSRSSREYPGFIFTVLDIRTVEGRTYYMLDMNNCSGLWSNEIERVTFTESDFEYVG